MSTPQLTSSSDLIGREGAVEGWSSSSSGRAVYNEDSERQRLGYAAKKTKEGCVCASNVNAPLVALSFSSSHHHDRSGVHKSSSNQSVLMRKRNQTTKQSKHEWQPSLLARAAAVVVVVKGEGKTVGRETAEVRQHVFISGIVVAFSIAVVLFFGLWAIGHAATTTTSTSATPFINPSPVPSFLYPSSSSSSPEDKDSTDNNTNNSDRLFFYVESQRQQHQQQPAAVKAFTAASDHPFFLSHYCNLQRHHHNDHHHHSGSTNTNSIFSSIMHRIFGRSSSSLSSSSSSPDVVDAVSLFPSAVVFATASSSDVAVVGQEAEGGEGLILTNSQEDRRRAFSISSSSSSSTFDAPPSFYASLAYDRDTNTIDVSRLAPNTDTSGPIRVAAFYCEEEERKGEGEGENTIANASLCSDALLVHKSRVMADGLTAAVHAVNKRVSAKTAMLTMSNPSNMNMNFDALLGFLDGRSAAEAQSAYQFEEALLSALNSNSNSSSSNSGAEEGANQKGGINGRPVEILWIPVNNVSASSSSVAATTPPLKTMASLIDDLTVGYAAAANISAVFGLFSHSPQLIFESIVPKLEARNLMAFGTAISSSDLDYNSSATTTPAATKRSISSRSVVVSRPHSELELISIVSELVVTRHLKRIALLVATTTTEAGSGVGGVETLTGPSAAVLSKLNYLLKPFHLSIGGDYYNNNTTSSGSSGSSTGDSRGSGFLFTLPQDVFDASSSSSLTSPQQLKDRLDTLLSDTDSGSSASQWRRFVASRPQAVVLMGLEPSSSLSSLSTSAVARFVSKCVETFGEKGGSSSLSSSSSSLSLTPPFVIAAGSGMGEMLATLLPTVNTSSSSPSSPLGVDVVVAQPAADTLSGKSDMLLGAFFHQIGINISASSLSSSSSEGVFSLLAPAVFDPLPPSRLFFSPTAFYANTSHYVDASVAVAAFTDAAVMLKLIERSGLNTNRARVARASMSNAIVRFGGPISTDENDSSDANSEDVSGPSYTKTSQQQEEQQQVAMFGLFSLDCSVFTATPSSSSANTNRKKCFNNKGAHTARLVGLNISSGLPMPETLSVLRTPATMVMGRLTDEAESAAGETLLFARQVVFHVAGVAVSSATSSPLPSSSAWAVEGSRSAFIVAEEAEIEVEALSAAAATSSSSSSSSQQQLSLLSICGSTSPQRFREVFGAEHMTVVLSNLSSPSSSSSPSSPSPSSPVSISSSSLLVDEIASIATNQHVSVIFGGMVDYGMFSRNMTRVSFLQQQQGIAAAPSSFISADHNELFFSDDEETLVVNNSSSSSSDHNLVVIVNPQPIHPRLWPTTHNLNTNVSVSSATLSAKKQFLRNVISFLPTLQQEFYATAAILYYRWKRQLLDAQSSASSSILSDGGLAALGDGEDIAASFPADGINGCAAGASSGSSSSSQLRTIENISTDHVLLVVADSDGGWSNTSSSPSSSSDASAEIRFSDLVGYSSSLASNTTEGDAFILPSFALGKEGFESIRSVFKGAFHTNMMRVGNSSGGGVSDADDEVVFFPFRTSSSSSSSSPSQLAQWLSTHKVTAAATQPASATTFVYLIGLSSLLADGEIAALKTFILNNNNNNGIIKVKVVLPFRTFELHFEALADLLNTSSSSGTVDGTALLAGDAILVASALPLWSASSSSSARAFHTADAETVSPLLPPVDSLLSENNTIFNRWLKSTSSSPLLSRTPATLSAFIAHAALGEIANKVQPPKQAMAKELLDILYQERTVRAGSDEKQTTNSNSSATGTSSASFFSFGPFVSTPCPTTTTTSSSTSSTSSLCEVNFPTLPMRLLPLSVLLGLRTATSAEERDFVTPPTVMTFMDLPTASSHTDSGASLSVSGKSDDGANTTTIAIVVGVVGGMFVLAALIILLLYCLCCAGGRGADGFFAKFFHFSNQGGYGRDLRNAPKDSTKPFTIMFTDIQRSTSLWAEIPELMGEAIDAHHTIIRSLIKKYRGYEVKTIGDAFMIAFVSAKDAVNLGYDLQQEFFRYDFSGVADIDRCLREFEMQIIAEQDDDADVTAFAAFSCYLNEEQYVKSWRGIRVRVGLHTSMGEIKLDDVTQAYDYYGTISNVAARVEAAAHGGQVVCTDASRKAYLEAVAEEKAIREGRPNRKGTVAAMSGSKIGRGGGGGVDEDDLGINMTIPEMGALPSRFAEDFEDDESVNVVGGRKSITNTTNGEPKPPLAPPGGGPSNFGSSFVSNDPNVLNQLKSANTNKTFFSNNTATATAKSTTAKQETDSKKPPSSSAAGNTSVNVAHTGNYDANGDPIIVFTDLGYNVLRGVPDPMWLHQIETIPGRKFGPLRVEVPPVNQEEEEESDNGSSQQESLSRMIAKELQRLTDLTIAILRTTFSPIPAKKRMTDFKALCKTWRVKHKTIETIKTKMHVEHEEDETRFLRGGANGGANPNVSVSAGEQHLPFPPSSHLSGAATTTATNNRFKNFGGQSVAGAVNGFNQTAKAKLIEEEAYIQSVAPLIAAVAIKKLPRSQLLLLVGEGSRGMTNGIGGAGGGPSIAESGQVMNGRSGFRGGGISPKQSAFDNISFAHNPMKLGAGGGGGFGGSATPSNMNAFLPPLNLHAAGAANGTHNMFATGASAATGRLSPTNYNSNNNHYNGNTLGIAATDAYGNHFPTLQHGGGSAGAAGFSAHISNMHNAVSAFESTSALLSNYANGGSTAANRLLSAAAGDRGAGGELSGGEEDPRNNRASLLAKLTANGGGPLGGGDKFQSAGNSQLNSNDELNNAVAMASNNNNNQLQNNSGGRTLSVAGGGAAGGGGNDDLSYIDGASSSMNNYFNTNNNANGNKQQNNANSSMIGVAAAAGLMFNNGSFSVNTSNFLANAAGSSTSNANGMPKGLYTHMDALRKEADKWNAIATSAAAFPNDILPEEVVERQKQILRHAAATAQKEKGGLRSAALQMLLDNTADRAAKNKWRDERQKLLAAHGMVAGYNHLPPPSSSDAEAISRLRNIYQLQFPEWFGDTAAAAAAPTPSTVATGVLPIGAEANGQFPPRSNSTSNNPLAGSNSNNKARLDTNNTKPFGGSGSGNNATATGAVPPTVTSAANSAGGGEIPSPTPPVVLMGTNNSNNINQDANTDKDGPINLSALAAAANDRQKLLNEHGIKSGYSHLPPPTSSDYEAKERLKNIFAEQFGELYARAAPTTTNTNTTKTNNTNSTLPNLNLPTAAVHPMPSNTNSAFGGPSATTTPLRPPAPALQPHSTSMDDFSNNNNRVMAVTPPQSLPSPIHFQNNNNNADNGAATALFLGGGLPGSTYSPASRGATPSHQQQTLLLNAVPPVSLSNRTSPKLGPSSVDARFSAPPPLLFPPQTAATSNPYAERLGGGMGLLSTTTALPPPAASEEEAAQRLKALLFSGGGPLGAPPQPQTTQQPPPAQHQQNHMMRNNNGFHNDDSSPLQASATIFNSQYAHPFQNSKNGGGGGLAGTLGSSDPLLHSSSTATNNNNDSTILSVDDALRIADEINYHGDKKFGLGIGRKATIAPPSPQRAPQHAAAIAAAIAAANSANNNTNNGGGAIPDGSVNTNSTNLVSFTPLVQFHEGVGVSGGGGGGGKTLQHRQSISEANGDILEAVVMGGGGGAGGQKTAMMGASGSARNNNNNNASSSPHHQFGRALNSESSNNGLLPMVELVNSVAIHRNNTIKHDPNNANNNDASAGGGAGYAMPSSSAAAAVAAPFAGSPSFNSADLPPHTLDEKSHTIVGVGNYAHGIVADYLSSGNNTTASHLQHHANNNNNNYLHGGSSATPSTTAGGGNLSTRDNSAVFPATRHSSVRKPPPPPPNPAAAAYVQNNNNNKSNNSAVPAPHPQQAQHGGGGQIFDSSNSLISSPTHNLAATAKFGGPSGSGEDPPLTTNNSISTTAAAMMKGGSTYQLLNSTTPHGFEMVNSFNNNAAASATMTTGNSYSTAATTTTTVPPRGTTRHNSISAAVSDGKEGSVGAGGRPAGSAPLPLPVTTTATSSSRPIGISRVTSVDTFASVGHASPSSAAVGLLTRAPSQNPTAATATNSMAGSSNNNVAASGAGVSVMPRNLSNLNIE